MCIYIYRDTSSPPGIIVLLALRQRNLDLLESKARAVSDPGNREYGRYLERDEIYGIAGPWRYDLDVVKQFFANVPGTLEFSYGGDFARYTCTIACIEKVFNTTLRFQTGTVAPGTTPIRASEPIQLPREMQNALEGTSLNAPLFMPPHPVPGSSLDEHALFFIRTVEALIQRVAKAAESCHYGLIDLKDTIISP